MLPITLCSEDFYANYKVLDVSTKKISHRRTSIFHQNRNEIKIIKFKNHQRHKGEDIKKLLNKKTDHVRWSFLFFDRKIIFKKKDYLFIYLLPLSTV